MKDIKLVKKSILLFKNNLEKVILFFSVFVIAFLIIVKQRESYSLQFEGNMMNTFPTEITDQKENIIEVYFINDTRENIDSRYSNATIKADLTYNSTGSVKGWLEPSTEDESKYILYVGSVGKTYLNTGTGMFAGWKNLEKIDFSNLDTSQVTSMGSMFYNCNSLTSLDLSSFDTSQVTRMDWMFYDCSSLISLDVSKFNTSQVTDMRSMFFGCSSLTSLNVSNFDTSKVTDMMMLFSYCSSLTSLDVSKFNTNQVTTMRTMFSGCKSLTTLDLSNFDTSQVTDMNYMFSNCSSLIVLDLSNFDTSQVTNMSSMFNGCSLESLIDTNNLTSIFYDKSIIEISDDIKIKIFDFKTKYVKKILNAPDGYNSKNVKKEDNSNMITGDYLVKDNKKYFVYIPGDVDGDGNLKLADIMKTANYLYKDKSSLTSVYLKAADYDQNNSYNLQDIMKMANRLYKGGI